MLPLFNYYCCFTEEKQQHDCECRGLAATEVVRAICDADFQSNGLDLSDPDLGVHFSYEYAKPPKDGMYLLVIHRQTDNLSMLVFIDTRTNPNYLWVEKIECYEVETICQLVAVSLCNAFNKALEKSEWKVTMNDFVSGNLNDVGLLGSAQAYINEYLFEHIIPKFSSFVTYEDRTAEIINMLHVMLENKVTPISIMRVIKAAIDAGLIEKPDFDSFVYEFKKEGLISRSAFKIYTKKTGNVLVKDKVYLGYMDRFLRLKDKWFEADGLN